MSKKFNLKLAKKNSENGDACNINMRLDRKDAPTQTTEQQLASRRVEEKHVLTESLLDKQRVNQGASLVEAQLNTAKGNFGIKFRNSDAHTGDINKVEEFRISQKNVQEKEKYELASSTHDKKKFWKVKSEDGLKLASKKNLSKKAQSASPLDFSDDGERFNHLEEIWPEEESGIHDDKEIDIADIEDEMGKANDLSSMTIVKKTQNKEPFAVIYFALEYDSGEFKGSEEEIRKAAYEKVIDEMPSLEGKIDIYDFDKPRVSGGIGKIAIRLVGDEYFETSSGLFEFDLKEVAHKDIDSPQGKIYAGTVKAENVNEANSEDAIIAAIDYVNDLYPNLSLTRDSVDSSNLLARGEISYVKEVEFEDVAEESLSLASSRNFIKKYSAVDELKKK